MIDSLIICFLFLMVLNSIMVISSQNSIHSVLFLVLNFVVAAGILLLLEREFMALIFLIIYVGAISVLFIFVVMMLDIKITGDRKDFIKYFPIGSLISILFLFEMVYVIFGCFKENPYKTSFYDSFYTNWFTNLDTLNDIESLGQIIYTHFVIQFLVAGLILLLSVIAAVALTKNIRVNQPKKQSLFKQISRNYKSVVLSLY